MDNITPEIVWAATLATASAIVLLANAVEKIVKAYKTARAPSARQDERIGALEAWRAEVDRKLISDHDRLSAIDCDNRVSMHALLALLDHGIDGNNIEQMQHAKEELRDHLINR